MKTCGGCRRACWWVGSLLAILLVGLAAPPARAGCGDYVVFGTKAAPAAATMPEAEHPAQAPAPCHGPSCSRGHVPPVAPAPAPRALYEQGADLAQLPQVAPPERSHVPPAAERLHPSRYVSSIFHPPRAAGLSFLA